jgi:hypothetical protein
MQSSLELQHTSSQEANVLESCIEFVKNPIIIIEENDFPKAKE